MSESQENYLTDLQEKQLQVINHYGIDKQYDQLIEECSELIQAICKYKRYQTDESKAKISSEIADVENLIEQIKMKDDFIEIGVRKFKEYKVHRELERINNRLIRNRLKREASRVWAKLK